MTGGDRPRSRSALPALRPGVAVIPMEGGVQVRRGDEEVHVLRTGAPDRVLDVLACLDGARDDSERAARIARLDAGGAHLLEELTDQLRGAGLLQGEDPAALLRGARVGVVGHAESASLVARVLAEHGMAADVIERASLRGITASAGADAGLAGALVCVWEAPDLALSFEVNDAVCKARLPCLFVDLSHGRHATVGPFYVPGEGACYRCLRRRLHESTAAFAELRAAEQRMLDTGRPLAAFGCRPAHRHLVAGLAAGEVVAFFTRERPLRTLGRAITVALERAEMWSEPVWRVPWCETCR